MRYPDGPMHARTAPPYLGLDWFLAHKHDRICLFRPDGRCLSACVPEAAILCSTPDRMKGRSWQGFRLDRSFLGPCRESSRFAVEFGRPAIVQGQQQLASLYRRHECDMSPIPIDWTAATIAPTVQATPLTAPPLSSASTTWMCLLLDCDVETRG